MGIVWILGAGFSRPLGGPLLGNLLSAESARDLGIRYPDASYRKDPATPAVRWLFQYGNPNRPASYRLLGKSGKRIPGERLWDDAEQFLDYLDTAATKGPEGPLALRILGILDSALGIDAALQSYQGLNRMTHAARRLMAAECCSFLEGIDPDSERWSPYQRWLREIFTFGEDTVVSFNYDLVVEMLADAQSARDRFQYRRTQKDPNDRPPVVFSLLLKLHGSVNWAILRDGEKPTGIDTNSGVRAAIYAPDPALAIAGPGPHKKTLSQGLFKWCWDEAHSALASADTIVFIGYRFPPTDAEARQEILGAIQDNDSTHIAIHTVLGPNVMSDDSRRLKGLLEHATRHKRVDRNGAVAPGVTPRTFSITQHPLWAEDFLSVVDRRSLRP